MWTGAYHKLSSMTIAVAYLHFEQKGDNTAEVNAKRKEIDAARRAGVQRGNLFYKVTVKV